MQRNRAEQEVESGGAILGRKELRSDPPRKGGSCSSWRQAGTGEASQRPGSVRGRGGRTQPRHAPPAAAELARRGDPHPSRPGNAPTTALHNKDNARSIPPSHACLNLLVRLLLLLLLDELLQRLRQLAGLHTHGKVGEGRGGTQEGGVLSGAVVPVAPPPLPLPFSSTEAHARACWPCLHEFQQLCLLFRCPLPLLLLSRLDLGYDLRHSRRSRHSRGDAPKWGWAGRARVEQARACSGTHASKAHPLQLGGVAPIAWAHPTPASSTATTAPR